MAGFLAPSVRRLWSPQNTLRTRCLRILPAESRVIGTKAVRALAGLEDISAGTAVEVVGSGRAASDQARLGRRTPVTFVTLTSSAAGTP